MYHCAFHIKLFIGQITPRFWSITKFKSCSRHKPTRKKIVKRRRGNLIDAFLHVPRQLLLLYRHVFSLEDYWGLSILRNLVQNLMPYAHRLYPPCDELFHQPNIPMKHHFYTLLCLYQIQHGTFMLAWILKKKHRIYKEYCGFIHSEKPSSTWRNCEMQSWVNLLCFYAWALNTWGNCHVNTSDDMTASPYRNKNSFLSRK